MRFTYQGEKQTYFFGVDKVGGLFLSVCSSNETPILNFTEFFPFHQRFLKEELDKAIDEGIIPQEDFEAILSTELGDYQVFFEGIQCQQDEWDDTIECPKAIEEYVENIFSEDCNGLTVKNMSDYLEFVQHFKKHEVITFDEAHWLNMDTLDLEYEFSNDLVGIA